MLSLHARERKYDLLPFYFSICIDVPVQLKELGFDGYVLDYVTYPEGLLWFLQCELRMHRVVRHILFFVSSQSQVVQAVGDDRIDVRKAMDAVTRREPANFITGWTMNQVTRSSYGRRLASNMTRPVRQARTFGAASGTCRLRI